jgi:transcriptional regulator of aromatic amino acid metabolism
MRILRKIAEKIMTIRMNKKRQVAESLLSAYLSNPGRFSMLILGKPGTGKSHWVRQIQSQICDQVDCTKSLHEVSLRTIEPNKEAWINIFEQAHGGILVLKELEHIKPHDALLFEALSTADGSFGFSQEKRFKIRIVFTTSYGIDSLRKTEELISHRLFDRIAQLVVKFPSLREYNRGIWKDFQATWQKMAFQAQAELPGTPLKIWLEKEHADFLHGNFRDLDKIAILWHQFRLMEVEEAEILEKVKAQLFTYSAYPEQHTDLGDAFYFQAGKSKDELMGEFKASLKRWAINTYGTSRKAEEALGIGKRTWDRW